jgi:hypothetical protein
MYDTYEDDDDSQESSNDGSSAMKQLRRANAQQAKQIKDLQEKLDGTNKGLRERSIKDVLSQRGLNPKIAAFVPADLEPDEASISKWVDDYADVFGGASKTDTGPTMSQEDIGSLKAMDQTTAGGGAPMGQDALLERVKTMPIDELLALIGGEVG